MRPRPGHKVIFLTLRKLKYYPCLPTRFLKSPKYGDFIPLHVTIFFKSSPSCLNPNLSCYILWLCECLERCIYCFLFLRSNLGTSSQLSFLPSVFSKPKTPMFSTFLPILASSSWGSHIFLELRCPRIRVPQTNPCATQGTQIALWINNTLV